LSVAHGKLLSMTAWKDVESAEPEFAARVRGLLDAHVNKILATLRADGSPRVSGVEVEFRDGELLFGSMANARKGADLHRDPRFALHSASPDPGEPKDWAGDAKIAGRAVPFGPVEATDGAPEGETFRADITEVVVTRLNETADRLVIESWRPGVGLRRVERT
jgi:hypothetical protein